MRRLRTGRPHQPRLAPKSRASAAQTSAEAAPTKSQFESGIWTGSPAPPVVNRFQIMPLKW